MPAEAAKAAQGSKAAATVDGVDLAVIGLGYVGLPLVVESSRAGLVVTGFDVDPAVVDALNAGRSHVDDVSDTDVQASRAAGFVASCSEDALAGARAVIICVPTPLRRDGGPDLSAVTGAVEAVARQLRPGVLVVLESTTYPGTTDQLVRPLLERTGLRAGRDFALAFSPERIDPGNRTYGLRNTPKVVGGHTPACTSAAAAFYGKFVDTVVQARGTREAEMAKLLENTYRHVNIALVNEMALFSRELGVDLWDAIACAQTKPFGFEAFRPGPGVGGHCIPIDPNYLSHQVRSSLGSSFRFVELAQEINSAMPGYVARRVQDNLNEVGKSLKNAEVLLLGVTYKADVADQRESPARPLAARLLQAGARVRFHDPFVADWTLDDRALPRVGDLDEALSEADIVVVLQHHSEYDTGHIAALARRVLDTGGRTPAAANVELL